MRNSLILSLLGSLTGLSAASIAPTSSASALVSSIVGPGITVVGTPTLVGITNQQGRFSGGLATVGFDRGIVLSSGDVNTFSGPNQSRPETLSSGGTGSGNDVSVQLGTPGDASLAALAGGTSFDANVLTFDFQFGDGSAGGDVFFNFVFASEEYIDFVNTSFNDVFAFFLNGENLALVAGQPITINTINPVVNSASYINNVPNTNGYPNAGRDIRFDGLTVPLQAAKKGLGAGTHTISLRISDIADSRLDSAVFIQAGTFTTAPVDPKIPEPGTVALMVTGLAAILAGRLRRRS